MVQYILDLNENRFSDGVIRQFTGNICALSVQKFSSNVIEKVRLSFTFGNGFQFCFYSAYELQKTGRVN